MQEPRRLKELIKSGTWDDVRQALGACGDTLLAVCSWIVDNHERDTTNLTLYNLLAGAVPFVQIAREHLLDPIQLIAFSTRNVFEINLRARHVLQSDANLQQWIAECFADNIQVLEGILQLREAASPADIAIIEEEIKRLRSVALRYGVADSAKLLSVRDLAKAGSREEDYRVLFKLYSKLVHPSSYLLNGSADNAHGVAIRQILVVKLQLYAYDLLERIRQRLKIPDEALSNQETGTVTK
jgi:hypothetical protein